MKPDAWSNLAYFVAGLALYQTPAIAVFMALLAAASFMGHHRGGAWWAADWAAMYLVFSAIALSHCGMSPWLALIPAALGYKYGVERYAAFGVLWILSMASAQYAGIQIAVPALIFAAGLACQLSAGSHGPGPRYQILHSTWHFATAAGIYLIA